MSDEDKKVPAEAEKTEEKAPQPSSEEKPKEETGAPLDLPEKLKGKSAEEIAGIYTNLEKEYKKRDGEITESRTLQEKMNTVLQAIWRNPDLYRSVEKEINSMSGGDDPISGVKAPTLDKERGAEEAGKDKKAPSTDQRRYLENQIISGFQQRFGLDKLPPKERQELMQQVSTSWANMLDPKGVKTKSDLLSSVELDVLPNQLENAYWLTQKDSLVDKGTLPSQDLASIGNMPSASGKSDGGVELTTKERETAEKLGVSTEKYSKRKQQITKEFTKE